MNDLRIVTASAAVEDPSIAPLLKRFESEIGCIGECADRLGQMAAELGKSQAETVKLIANNLRANAAFVVQVLREVESRVVANPPTPLTNVTA